MTQVADLIRWLDEFAPFRLAESWDNVGLLWGDPGTRVARVMTCLTVTPETASEAIEGGAGLIVSHHPVLFRAVQQIRADRSPGSYLWPLARAGVAIASPHTAFDNTRGGINDGLAELLGLIDVGPLRPFEEPAQCKVVAFVPEADRETVLEAAFRAGAGRIGLYEECSFSIPGRGTFFGTEGADPSVGRKGHRESVEEQRIEWVCPEGAVTQVVSAIRGAHSYEEPAIDVYPLKPISSVGGAGRVGQLPTPCDLATFARSVGDKLGAHGLQVVGDPGRGIERVAIVCGAGDDFLRDALRVGADALLTGEARFHRALEAEALGLAMIVAGHYATERPGVEALSDRIASAFPALEVWASRRERDPLRSLA
ncbi:MAG: Nif3-like dinuclear metal center hexameric protein [Isosphaeraceae bacterium]